MDFAGGVMVFPTSVMDVASGITDFASGVMDFVGSEINILRISKRNRSVLNAIGLRIRARSG